MSIFQQALGLFWLNLLRVVGENRVSGRIVVMQIAVQNVKTEVTHITTGYTVAIFEGIRMNRRTITTYRWQ